jgi:hypothetical protein
MKHHSILALLLRVVQKGTEGILMAKKKTPRVRDTKMTYTPKHSLADLRKRKEASSSPW